EDGVVEGYIRAAGIDKVDAREIHHRRTPSLRMANDVGIGFASTAPGPCVIAVQIERDHAADTVAKVEDQGFASGSHCESGRRRMDRMQVLQPVDALGPLPTFSIDMPTVGM